MMFAIYFQLDSEKKKKTERKQMQQKCIGVFKVFFFYVTESLKIKKISWERGVKLKMIIDVLFTY